MRIEPRSGTAIVACDGVVGLSDARDAAARLWRTPEWSGDAAVWDCRGAELDVTPGQARELAQYILENQRLPPPKRMAFVAGREVDFGMVRIFAAHRESHETEFTVFRELDEAIRWACGPEPD